MSEHGESFKLFLEDRFMSKIKNNKMNKWTYMKHLQKHLTPRGPNFRKNLTCFSRTFQNKPSSYDTVLKWEKERAI